MKVSLIGWFSFRSDVGWTEVNPLRSSSVCRVCLCGSGETLIACFQSKGWFNASALLLELCIKGPRPQISPALLEMTGWRLGMIYTSHRIQREKLTHILTTTVWNYFVKFTPHGKLNEFISNEYAVDSFFVLHLYWEE